MKLSVSFPLARLAPTCPSQSKSSHAQRYRQSWGWRRGPPWHNTEEADEARPRAMASRRSRSAGRPTPPCLAAASMCGRRGPAIRRRPAWPQPPCAAAVARPPASASVRGGPGASVCSRRSPAAAARRPERRRRVGEGAAVEQERGVTREAAAAGVGRRRKGIGRGGWEPHWRLGFHRVVGFVSLWAW